MKQITDYPNYSITQDGIIINKKNNRKLNPIINHKGYYQVKLYNEGNVKVFLVHRLIAKAFISNIENKPFINHINAIKHDNRLCNLEWVSHSENMIHGFKNGLCKPHNRLKDLQKEMSENKKKKVYHYNSNKELLQVFNSVKESEQLLGYKGNLSLYCRTNQLTKKGIFSYVPLV